MMATRIIESGRLWKHSRNLSIVLTDRALVFFYTSEYLSLIHVICFSQFSYAVDRDGASPARDYPKPWLDFLNAEGCVRTYLIHNITATRLAT